VLVVDDEPRLLSAIEMLLAADHDVVTASSGDDAATILSERGAEFDVVLCDLMMSGCSGMDLYERIARSSPALSRRFIMMTGGACTPRAAAFLARVPNRVLDKPFSLVSVQAAIRGVLDETDHSRTKVPNLSGT
jgi:DNA-binding NtrC family response regulator